MTKEAVIHIRVHTLGHPLFYFLFYFELVVFETLTMSSLGTPNQIRGTGSYNDVPESCICPVGGRTPFNYRVPQKEERAEVCAVKI